MTAFRFIAAAALLASAPGHAGKIVTESNADGRRNIETLEFNDKGYVRITSNGLDALGMIARDKRVYFFGELKGKPVVVDMLAAAGKLQAKGMKRPESDPALEEIAGIKPTGRKQTVAGVDGEVHAVTWVLAGKSRIEEIVLTRDPRLAGAIQGLALDPGLLSQKPRKTDLKAMVHALGAFLLQAPGSVVTSADFSPTPDARFALNAKPGDDAGVLMQVIMSAAFGAITEVVGAVADATGKAMKEAFARPEPQTPSGEPATLGSELGASETPLHKAARNGDNDRVKALLARGADVNARTRDRDGATALHLAAGSGHRQIAESLIAGGADVNAGDNDGDTPLHWSAIKDQKEIAELLIARHANVHARNQAGETPLQMAMGRGKHELAALFKKHGARTAP
jgi:Ankyrin repeats (3 copies)/Ankyrin repeat